MSYTSHNSIPIWSWAAPLLAGVLLGLKYAGIVPADHAALLLLAAAFLGAAVFASVHHAELLAVRLGEPYGSILLAIAVTVIEIGLIVSIMASELPGSMTVARDTVFSAVMIVMNGVIGLCMVLGARRHHEQEFQIKGASSALAVLGTLAVIALVLPNYVLSEPGPFYSTAQMAVIGVASLALYATFVFVQTVGHRDYFIAKADDKDSAGDRPSSRTSLITLFLLLVSLTAVVLLSKALSKPIDETVAAFGLPRAFVGVVIATIVLLPEGIASVHAALLNRLQNSINLAIGSAIASIGLTIPAVAIVSLASDQPLALGINTANTVLLVLTLFMGTITLGTGRTTVLQGAVHLVIFAVFLLIAAVP